MTWLEIVILAVIIIIGVAFALLHHLKKSKDEETGETNEQAEKMIIIINKLLLLASAGLNALFTYQLLLGYGVLIALLGATFMAGVNFAESPAIRWVIISAREKKHLSKIVAGLLTACIVAYSLVAGSSAFNSMANQNQRLVTADQLDIQAIKIQAENARKSYDNMVSSGSYSESTLNNAEIHVRNMEAKAARQEASAIRSGTVEVKTTFIFWAVSAAFVMGLLSLALEAAIIATTAFTEGYLSPTPLPGILRYVDQWLSPDVRVEDAVLQNPWGGGNADKIGFVENNVQLRKAQMAADVYKIQKEAHQPNPNALPVNQQQDQQQNDERPALQNEQKKAPTMGFVDTNDIAKTPSPLPENKEKKGKKDGSYKRGLHTQKKTPKSLENKGITPEEGERVYKIGVKHALMGMDGDDCPYTKGSENKKYWSDGWMSIVHQRPEDVEQRLKAANNSGVGTPIQCVYCGKEITKKSHTQKFCSHSRKPREDGGNCSNDYTRRIAA